MPPPPKARPLGATALPLPKGPPPTPAPGSREDLDRRLAAVSRGGRASGAASTAGDTEAEYEVVERAFAPEAHHQAHDPQAETDRPEAADAPAQPHQELWVVAVVRNAPARNRLLQAPYGAAGPPRQRDPAPGNAAPPPPPPGPPPGFLARLRRVDAWTQLPLFGATGPREHARPPTVALDPESVGAPPTTAAVAAEVGRPQATAHHSADTGRRALAQTRQEEARAQSEALLGGPLPADHPLAPLPILAPPSIWP